MRAVIDTNIWVSAVLRAEGLPARILSALAEEQFTLIVSEPVLEELVELLSRPRMIPRYGVTREAAAGVLPVLRRQGELVELTGTVAVCRDPDDG